MPDAESPLVNEFKCDFIRRRLVETFLGGPKIRSCSKTTISLQVSQFFLHLFPLLIATICLTLYEVDLVPTGTCSYIVGGVMFIFTIMVQLSSCYSQFQATVIAPVKPKLVQISEDDILESASCCSSESLQFVIPTKKYKLNILFHALVSGVVCGLSFHYLSPTTLNDLFSNKWANYLLLVWGWLVVCIAQYSLTTAAPPEPVVFHPLDTYESTALMRPIYILLFLLIHVNSWYYPFWVDIDHSLHILFAFLPFLWFMGIFPPLDALFPWLGEQILIYVFGGTSMASDVRLLVMLTLSIITVTIIYFLPCFMTCLTVAAVTGYVFSLDLCKFWNMLIQPCKKGRSESKYTVNAASPREKSLSLCGNLLVFLLYLIVFAMGAFLFVFSHNELTQEKKENLKESFGYILLCLTAFNSILCSVQQVYIVHGFFINPLYPTDCAQAATFQRRIKPLNFLGYLRIILIFIGSPLFMISYLRLFISQSEFNIFPHKFIHEKIFFAIVIVRAFRWIWQHTENALLEMTLIHYINHFYPSLLSSRMNLAAELLLAAFVHNRLRQMWHKLHLVFVVLVTSISLARQRQRFSSVLAVLNLIFLPVVILIVSATCLVSAPLLPLFTLPIFLVGFPRPLRMWPGQIKKNATLSGDSVYYKQLTPSLMLGLQRYHLLGSLGHVAPGDYFLIHFEDRLIFVLILEKGYGYCTFGVKGLELQETSCHAVEATHLDLLLTAAFEGSNREQSNRRNPICMNPEPFHVFHPLTTLYLYTYSDTRNVLTGLIDSPDTLKLIAGSYVKTLTWVLLQHHLKKYLDEQSQLRPAQNCDSKQNDLVQPIAVNNSRPRTADSLNKLPRAKRISSCFEESSPAKSPHEKKGDVTVNAKEATLPTTNNGWSDEDDEDPLGEDPPAIRQSINVLAHPSDSSVMSRPGTTTILYATHLPGTIGDSRDHELEFGLPAVDVSLGEKGDAKMPSASNRRTIIENKVNYTETGSKLAPAFDFSELPLDKKEMNALRDQYPIKWYYFVLGHIGKKLQLKEKAQNDLESDEALLKAYRELCLSCHAIVNLLAMKNDVHMHLRPTHVYKTFNGEIQWSPYEGWLINNKELLVLALKAYGYATKLALDQILMGESGTDEEVLEYLLEYDNSWYIGSDISNLWEENIVQEKRNLFSLGFNPIQRTFTSHLLTLQHLPVHVGRLNPEVVRGIWASLAFELLYLTNDDEERYSIQAHPIILRNLIVQAADSPLGYPIFTSDPISVGFDSMWKTKLELP